MAELLDIPGLANMGPDFLAALVQQSSDAGFDPSLVAAVIKLESNFNPAARNPGGHALGLLQWWDSYFPATAAAAGQPNVQWADLPSMSAIDQLPFVIAYLEQATTRPLVTPTDYRLAVFMPAFVGASPDTVLGQQGSNALLPGTNLTLGTIYAQNQGLDANGDGLITVADVGSQIENLIAAARTRPPIQVDGVTGDTLPALGKLGSPVVLLALAGLFFCPHCSGQCRVAVKFERLDEHVPPHPHLPPHSSPTRHA